eukprot:m.1635171 g.1635171  ORF g.1635171 m.1635171 type:complete len:4171 (-) comp25420_c1_seq1:3546-16058(-)
MPSSDNMLQHITEQRLFLGDCLRMISSEIPAGQELGLQIHSQDVGAPVDESSGDAPNVGDGDEVSQSLRKLEPRSENVGNIERLFQFRAAALQYIWKAENELRTSKPTFAEYSRAFESTDRQHGASTSGLGMRAVPSTNDLGLLLLLPLLESQSKSDPSLCGTTVKVLLEFLAEASPVTFSEGLPAVTRQKLEVLLTKWLEIDGQQTSVRNDAIAALVALTCAGGSFKSIAQTIALLGCISADTIIPVRRTIDRLARCVAAPTPVMLQDGSPECFWYFDQNANLVSASSNNAGDGNSTSTSASKTDKARPRSFKHPDYPHRVAYCTRASGWNCDGGCGYRSSRSVVDMPRFRCVDEGEDFDLCSLCLGPMVQQSRASVATDESFLFLYGWAYHGLIKVGTGRHGTIRGHVYARSSDTYGCDNGARITYGAGSVLIRPCDATTNLLCYSLDPITLTPLRELQRPTPRVPIQSQKDGAPPCGIGATWPSDMHPTEAGSIDPSLTEDVCFQVEGNRLYHVYMCHLAASGLGNSDETIPVVADVYDISDLQTTETSKPTRSSSASTEPPVPVLLSLVSRMVLQGASHVHGSMYGAMHANAHIVPSSAERMPTAGKLLRVPRQPGGGGGDGDKAAADRPTSCGLHMLVLRTGCTYVSGQSLIVVTKTLNHHQRIVFGSGGSGSQRALTLAQFNLPLSDDNRSQSASGIGGYQISDAIAEVLACSQFSDLCICPNGSDSGHLWIVAENIVELWAGTRPKLVGGSADTGLRDLTALTCPQEISVEETLEKMFDFLSGIAEKSNRLAAEEIDTMTTSAVSILQLSFDRQNKRGLLCGLQLLHLCLMSDASHATADDAANEKSALRQHDKVPVAKQLLFKHLMARDQPNGFRCTDTVRSCCDVITIGFSVFCPTAQDQHDVVSRVCTPGGDLVFLDGLRAKLLSCLPDVVATPDNALNLATQPDTYFAIIDTLLSWSEHEAQCALDECHRLVASGDMHHFTAPPSVTTLARLQTVLLSSLVTAVDTARDRGSGCKDATTETLCTHARRFVLLVLATCRRILEHVAQHPLAKDAFTDGLPTPHVREMLDMVLKTTPCGFLLPSIAVVCASPSVRQAGVGQGSDVMDHLRHVISASDTIAHLFEDVGIQLDQICMEKPWHRGVVMESIHPVRDNYKFSKTVTLAGADAIYLTFDPRCSSQYDYDKLVVSCGSPGTSDFRTVAEYGGNTAGFGSRSVLAGGWPKVPVRVAGNTVHFEFEMRSGRENGTPDIAMWGFRVVLRDREAVDESGGVFSFHTNLATSVATWLITLLREAYTAGVRSPPPPPLTTHEVEHCHELLECDMLQNFKRSDTCVVDSSDSGLVIPTPLMTWYSARTGCAPPTYPPSLAVDVDRSTLCDVFIGAAFNSVGALEYFRKQSVPTASDTVTPQATSEAEFFDLLFKHATEKLHGIERVLLTLSNYERMWQADVQDMQALGDGDDTNDPSTAAPPTQDTSFFSNWHVTPGKAKDLALLCQLVGVPYLEHNEKQVMGSLRMHLQMDVAAARSRAQADAARKNNADDDATPPPPLRKFPRIHALCNKFRERCMFLLRGTQGDDTLLSCAEDIHRVMIGSGPIDQSPLNGRDDGPQASRSLSAPSVVETLSNGMQRTSSSSRPGSSTTVPDAYCHIPQLDVIDKDFMAFVAHSVLQHASEHPSVSNAGLVAAVDARVRVAQQRVVALQTIRQLIAPTTPGKSAILQQYFLESFVGMMVECPVAANVGATGLASTLRSEFAHTLQAVAAVVGTRPVTNHRALGICAIPFKIQQAGCVSQSGVVKVLQKMCGSANVAVANTAWAGLHVLAVRCATWRSANMLPAAREAVEDLSTQLSAVLCHHLEAVTVANTATEDSSGARGSQKLRILHILDNLAGSQLGKHVVAHPQGVVALLRLLVDGGSAPKLLDNLTRLLGVALPAITAVADVGIALRAHPCFRSACDAAGSDAREWIVQIILDKLAEVVTPPCRKYHTPDTLCPPARGVVSLQGVSGALSEQVLLQSISSTPTGKFAVRLYRRPEQTARDVIQPLLKLNRRMFGSKESVEYIMRIDAELNEHTSAVAYSGDYKSCMHVATEWCQIGTVVSVERESTTAPSAGLENEKTELRLCQVMNETLQKQPTKRFVSAAVAGGIASHLIGLLQSLVATDDAAQVWLPATEAVLRRAVSKLPAVVPALACDDGSDPTDATIHAACNGLAAVCVMGAFRESIHPSGHALVGGPSLARVVGEVDVYEPEQGRARIKFPTFPQPLWVPMDCVQSVHAAPPANMVQLLNKEVLCVLDTLLATGDGEPMGVQAPVAIVEGRAADNPQSKVAFAHRLLADLRTRSCMLLCLKLRAGVAGAIPGTTSCRIIERLAIESRDFPHNSIPLVESESMAARDPFYEQFRPSHKQHVSRSDTGSPAPEWDMACAHPPIGGVFLLANKTGLRSTRIARSDSAVRRLHPIVYATGRLPVVGGYSYFETTIKTLKRSGVRMHDAHEHALVHVGIDDGWMCDIRGCPHGSQTAGLQRYRCSKGCDYDLCGDCIKGAANVDPVRIGFAPRIKRGSVRWGTDTVLLSTGLQVFRKSAAEREPVEYDATIVDSEALTVDEGDVIGCLLAVDSKYVEFFVNGRSVTRQVSVGSTDLVPAVHFEAPLCEVSTNLKVDTDAYPVKTELDPAMMDDEMELDGFEANFELNLDPQPRGNTTEFASVGPIPCTQPMAVVGQYALPPANATMRGAHHVVFGEEEEEEEDMTDRLIAAWEAEVFPKIHGRFRNSQERQSGFDQIKGALQFNMPDVAMDTVAGLYDDNGGIPADLHLPTMDDLKATAGRLGANEIQSGMQVRSVAAVGADLPAPATTSDARPTETSNAEPPRSLVGTVLRVDTNRSLALVEIYLPTEAALVHWWFPCSALELVDSHSADKTLSRSTHAAFLMCESKLTRLYCRSALLLCQELGAASLTPSQTLQLLAYESRAIPVAGKCTVHSATAQTFFQEGSAAQQSLVQSMQASWETAVATNTRADILSNVCGVLSMSSESANADCTQIAVSEGRKVTDIQFGSQYSDVMTTVKVKDEAARSDAVVKADEGPWMRIYAQEDINGPRVAVYPSPQRGVELPYYLIPSTRLHVRLRPQDLPDHLQVTLHALHRDVPLALAFLQGPVLHSATADTASLQLVARLLVSALVDVEQAPFARECLLHTLAAVMRAAGPVLDGSVRQQIGSIHSVLQKTDISTGSGAKYSTYLQALLELAVADKVNSKIYRLGHGSAGGSPVKTGMTGRGSEAAVVSPVKSFRDLDHGMSRIKRRRSSQSDSRRKRLGFLFDTRSSSMRGGGDGHGIKSWIKHAVDCELFLRVLLGSMAPDFSEEQSMVLAELAELGHAKSTTSHLSSSLFGVCRIAAKLDIAEVCALLSKSLMVCGGAVGDIVIGEPHDTFGRCAVVEMQSGFSVEAAKKAVDNVERLKTVPDLLYFTVDMRNGNTNVICDRVEHSMNESFLAVTSAAVNNFLTKKLVTDEKTLLPSMQTIFDEIFDLPANENVTISLVEVLEAHAKQSSDAQGCTACEFSETTVLAFLAALGYRDEAAVTTAVMSAVTQGEHMSPRDVHRFVTTLCTDAPARVMRALAEYGYDLQLRRYRYMNVEQAQQACDAQPWTLQQYVSLVDHMNALALQSRVPSSHLLACDISHPAHIECLHRFSLENVRLHACMLQVLNTMIVDVLPAVDFRGKQLPQSLSDLVSRARRLVFHDAKVTWLNAIIDDSAQRTDPTCPEIVLDPLETIQKRTPQLSETQYVQSMHQFESLDPALLRVKMASGGDPVFPMHVRFVGAAVAGASGSFREYLSRMVVELHGNVVPLLMPCPSAGFGLNANMYILRQQDIDYPLAKMLEFFGLLLGISLRSGVPLALDLLPCFWKSLVREPLDEHDLRAADCASADRLTKLLSFSSSEEFNEYVQDGDIGYACPGIGGERVLDLRQAMGLVRDTTDPMQEGGVAATAGDTLLAWSDRGRYVDAARSALLTELEAKPQLDAIRYGLGAILPTECLNALSGEDMEFRVCGRPHIDLAFLKSQTTYSVGLSELDAHVVYFWNALEALTQDQLRKFVKFACNQDRLPTSGASYGGGTVHVPPFPMKIAPPDGRGRPDNRFIRAETCMFMIKLPQYSSQELMTQRLASAIMCRDDPLIG